MSHIWWTPGRQSGAPCIGGTRIPVFQVAMAVAAGHPNQTAYDYSLSHEQLVLACAFVVAFRCPLYRSDARRQWKALAKAWRPWYEEHARHIGWKSYFVPLPAEVAL